MRFIQLSEIDRSFEFQITGVSVSQYHTSSLWLSYHIAYRYVMLCYVNYVTLFYGR